MKQIGVETRPLDGTELEETHKVQLSCYSCGATETRDANQRQELVKELQKQGWKVSRTGLPYCPNCPVSLNYPWHVNTHEVRWAIENVITGGVVHFGPSKTQHSRRSRTNYYDVAKAEAQRRNEAWRKENPNAQLPEGID
jgi:hypothetical protein